MLYIPLSESEVVERLMADEYANWSYAEAKAIAEYLQEMSEACGDMELDCVSARCEWTGYTFEEMQEQYPLTEDCNNFEDAAEKLRDSDYSVLLPEDNETILIKEW